MVFKVYYQSLYKKSIARKNTELLDTDSLFSAHTFFEDNTTYSVDFIEGLNGVALTYTKKHPNFKVTEL